MAKKVGETLGAAFMEAKVGKKVFGGQSGQNDH